MKKYLFLMIFLLFSCVSSDQGKKFNNNFNFSSDMSFDDFKNKLREYANKSPYPKIDD